SFDCPTYPTFAILPVAVAPQNAPARPRVPSENGPSLPPAESLGPFPPPAFQPRLLLLAKPLARSEEHTSELQSLAYLVCRLLLASATASVSALSLHDALPISLLTARPTLLSPFFPWRWLRKMLRRDRVCRPKMDLRYLPQNLWALSLHQPSSRGFYCWRNPSLDRKSTRLNSSH